MYSVEENIGCNILGMLQKSVPNPALTIIARSFFSQSIYQTNGSCTTHRFVEFIFLRVPLLARAVVNFCILQMSLSRIFFWSNRILRDYLRIFSRVVRYFRSTDRNYCTIDISKLTSYRLANMRAILEFSHYQSIDMFRSTFFDRKTIECK